MTTTKLRVFVTGGTGFVGAAVMRELLRAGHGVTALVRSPAAALPAGVTRVVGSLTDRDVTRAPPAAADAAVHCAYDHRFGALDICGFLAVRATRIAGLARVSPAARRDLHAIEDICANLGGTRAFVATSPIAVLPSGVVGAETDPATIRSFGCLRVASERAVVAAAARGVRTAALRLPPSVHGAGDRGFVANLIERARTTGVSAYPGDGANRWAAVHVDDAAALYRITLEGLATGAVPGGAIVHAVADDGVPLRDIAAAVADRLALAPPVSRAGRHFGAFARFAAMDNPASAVLTRARTGWQPTRPALLDDVGGPAYDPTATATRPLFAAEATR